ncbi:MAG: hypothetical protein LAQ30_21690 [Acidobacteriia bacterium]|nr:hypothetical protein [Terriglobia bacterium]
MSCSPFELKDYFLKELARPQALQVEVHVRGCPSCREELDRLRLTEAALFALREEEIPQRIAFVSDPVLEPSGPRRWWAAFWGSGPRLGFASAALLSAAILFSAMTRPAPAPASPPAVKLASAPPAATLSPEEVQRRIDAAVSAAVTQSRADTVKMVSELERANFAERQKIVNVYEAELLMERKRTNVQRGAIYRMASVEKGGAQ